MLRDDRGSLQAAEVYFNCHVLGQPLTLLSFWSEVSIDICRGISQWHTDRNVHLVSTSAILGTCIAKRYAESTVVLVPSYLR